MSENPLHLLMNPKSIAIAGAGNSPTKMGTIQALSIIKDGYQGKIYPIHLTEKTVLGHKAYAAVEDLPETPDLAMFIVPARVIIPLLESFGKIGTKRAIIVTAGFKETGADGQKMENRLTEIAGRYGIRFVGPNCLGIINSEIMLNTTVAPFVQKPGLLGFASQSGTYVTQALPYLKKRGVRYSKAISLGNEANIDIADALEYLGEDEQTRAIILYIEGIRNGKRFLEIARLITPHKPVLAQYVGGSKSGARAGLSHTGAMSGPDFLYDGLFRQAGIIRVGSIEELYMQGWTLATQPPLSGRRIGVMTNSGGPSTAISYTCDLVGLDVPRFSDKLQEEIKSMIEPHASAVNPVDLTFDTGMEKLVITIPEIMIRSGEVDAIVMHGAMNSGFLREIYSHAQDFLEGISLEDFLAAAGQVIPRAFDLPHQHKTPLLMSTFFDHEDNYTRGYQDTNTPVFFSPESAARAMGALYRYKLIKERARGGQITPPSVSEQAQSIIRQSLNNGQRALDEHKAKQLLACYGLPVTREIPAKTKKKSAEAARELGYPVALKACSWEIMHKSGKGLIALNIKNEAQLKRAFCSIQKAAGYAVPVLVQEMIAGGRELLVGMTRFAGFGPCVVFGLGGIFTEALADTTVRLAPLTAADAQEMFTEIRAGRLLADFRGLPPVDGDRLAEIIQAVGNIALLHPEIDEIDLNPIIISGSAPVIADALIVLGLKNSA